MEKQKNSIDNLFRETLKAHEIVPSERAKKAFLKEASEIAPQKWYRRGFFLFIALATLVIIGGFAIYFLPGKSFENEPSAIKSEPKSYQTEQKIIQQVPSPVHNKNSDPILKQAVTKETNTIKQPSFSNNKSKPSMASIEPNSDLAQSIPIVEAAIGTTNQHKDEISTGAIVVPATNIAPLSSEPSSKTSPMDTSSLIRDVSRDKIETLPSTASPENESKQNPNKDWYFSGAIQYTPEWMFNTLEGSKFVNNFGIEGILTFGKYSIRTGLELSITKGTNELLVEYNDFLGSYNKLDSMSFSWNGSMNDYIPSYYFSNQDVWDSLMKLDYPKVVKRYTYLQIPLVLGYDFFQSGRFSIGLRAGPLLSILINSKQLSEDYDPGKNRVIRINNITPEQVSLNWQFMGGINASVRLSKNLLFEIEPMAKYYFNSVYEKSDIKKKPWSVGARAAFIIKF
jgi:hypothetical protein